MSLYEISLSTGIVLSIIFLFTGSIYYDSKFKFVLLNVFLISFGGAGILIKNMNVVSSIYLVIISIIIGAIVSFLIYKAIINPLIKAENTSVASEKKFIGLKADVRLQVSDKQLGEIKFVFNGIIFNSPARANSPTVYEVGEEVIIVDIKDNVFIVD